MVKIGKKNVAEFTVVGVFKEDKYGKELLQESLAFTEYADQKLIKIFLNGKKDFNLDKFKRVVKSILNVRRNLQIDVATFVTSTLTIDQIVELIVDEYELKNGKIYNKKAAKNQPKVYDLILLNADSKLVQETFKKALVLAEAKTYARNFQVTPHCDLNSESFADTLKKDFAKYKNIKVTILNKSEIAKHKMGLFLAVNAGSKYEPRLVVLEYQGKKDSKEILGCVGKGIMYDTGGHSLKPSTSMATMKYDMSGAAILAGLMQAVAELKPNINVTAVLPLTDNMIGNNAILPDDVAIAMNGKSVEIANTDAEGRLILADALTYAATKLGATKLIDIATLTGAVIMSLGSLYTGAWASKDDFWAKFDKAAQNARELVWRMPLHEEYLKNMTESKVADLRNINLSDRSSNTAAMFLMQFSEKLPHIHLDIAGTANTGDVPHAPMLKTIYELAILLGAKK